MKDLRYLFRILIFVILWALMVLLIIAATYCDSKAQEEQLGRGFARVYETTLFNGTYSNVVKGKTQDGQMFIKAEIKDINADIAFLFDDLNTCIEFMVKLPAVDLIKQSIIEVLEEGGFNKINSFTWIKRDIKAIVIMDDYIYWNESLIP